jgi:hypothetical protein
VVPATPARTSGGLRRRASGGLSVSDRGRGGPRRHGRRKEHCNGDVARSGVCRKIAADLLPTCSVRAATLSGQSRDHPGDVFFSYQRGWPTGPRGLLSRGTVKQGQARLPDGRRACSCFA